MHVCFTCVCFRFSVLCQEIGWEERLQNDLFCVVLDMKPQLSLLCSLYVTHVHHLSAAFRVLYLCISDVLREVYFLVVLHFIAALV